MAPRLVSAGCSDLTLVDLGPEAPVVGARGRDDDGPLGWLEAPEPEETCGRPYVLSSGRAVAAAGVRGLVAGVDLPDALLAALTDDEDADDRVLLTCGGRPEDASSVVLSDELLPFSRRARESGELLLACDADVALVSRLSAGEQERGVTGGVRSQS